MQPSFLDPNNVRVPPKPDSEPKPKPELPGQPQKVNMKDLLTEYTRKLNEMTAATLNKNNDMLRKEIADRTLSTIGKVMAELHEIMRAELNKGMEQFAESEKVKIKEAMNEHIMEYSEDAIANMVLTVIRGDIAREFEAARDKSQQAVRANQVTWAPRWERWEAEKVQLNSLVSDMQEKVRAQGKDLAQSRDYAALLESRLGKAEGKVDMLRARILELEGKVAILRGQEYAKDSKAESPGDSAAGARRGDGGQGVQRAPKRP
jgi:hypothetical protein